MHRMTDVERTRFMGYLENKHSTYDPEERMITAYNSSSNPGFPSKVTGKVHHNVGSLRYAVALLDSGLEENRPRAVEILEKVISLQDTDLDSETYGIWSWYLEEPLDQMRVPDKNWADFCGVQLLQVALDHWERIPDNLKAKLRQSVLHACNSIIKREVLPSYTNIAIMDTYVTIVAGELFGAEDVFLYGKNHLRILADYTKVNGTFTEYNSPCYLVVALSELARILDHVTDKECITMAEGLNRLAWRCMAIHYHPATGQWAGPQSRSYDTLQGIPFWSVLQMATEGKVRLLKEEDMQMDINPYEYLPRIRYRCPEEFVRYFINPEVARTETELFAETYYIGDTRPKQKAVAYMSTFYTLGTFRVSDLWNQRRALLGYWGDRAKPVYMQLKCLKNGYDYSSAVIHSVQAEGNVLSIMNFATDGGDFHLYNDRIKDSIITAEDLRLRIEFGGSMEKLLLPDQWGFNQITRIRSGKVTVKICVPYCCFGRNEVKYEVGKNNGISYLDVVFYRGKETQICFSDLAEAVCAIALGISSEDEKELGSCPVNVEKKDDRICLKWQTCHELLQVESRIKPAKILELYTESLAGV